MSTAYDLVVGTVLSIIAMIIHRLGAELFAPDKPLYAIATDGTAVLNGASRVELWYQTLTIWMPILVIGGAWTYVMIRIYRRQVRTAVGRPG
jgi:uncharacterized membrane protein